jgi:hypothetical protein
MKELTIEELTAEALQLLPMGLQELYMLLGCQLMVTAKPTRVAGIMSYLSAARKAKVAKELYATLPLNPVASDWGEGLELIESELVQDGLSFLDAVREELRKGICNEDIFTIAEKVDASSMQIIIMIVGAILKMAPQFETVSATLAAILCKLGLREFCK